LRKIMEVGTAPVNYVFTVTKGAGFSDDEVRAEALRMGLIEDSDESGAVTWSEPPDPFAD